MRHGHRDQTHRNREHPPGKQRINPAQHAGRERIVPQQYGNIASFESEGLDRFALLCLGRKGQRAKLENECYGNEMEAASVIKSQVASHAESSSSRRKCVNIVRWKSYFPDARTFCFAAAGLSGQQSLCFLLRRLILRHSPVIAHRIILCVRINEIYRAVDDLICADRRPIH